MHSSHMRWERITPPCGYGRAGLFFPLLLFERRHDRGALGLVRLGCDGEIHRTRVMRTPREADGMSVGAKIATLSAAVAAAAFLAAAAAGSTASSASDPPNWAKKEIKAVVAHGLMGTSSVRRFQPNAALTVQTLADLATNLGQELGVSG